MNFNVSKSKRTRLKGLIKNGKRKTYDVAGTGIAAVLAKTVYLVICLYAL